MAESEDKIPRGSKCLVVFAMKNTQLMQGFRPHDREETAAFIKKSRKEAATEPWLELDCLTKIGIESLNIPWEQVSGYYVADIPVKSLIDIPGMQVPSDVAYQVM